MASLHLLLPLLLILSVVSAAGESSPPLPPSFVNAAETLANSGYTSMSLTLQLNAPTLPLPSNPITALTIFSPPDAAFASSGQPSLALLLLHFSPLSLSPESLLSLPFSSTIPSLSPSKHLTITSNQTQKISINNVGISELPIFDDGFVIVYTSDDFFDLNFTLNLTNSTNTKPKSDFQCLKLGTSSRFEEASRLLKSRGYSIVATFLELQLMGFLDQGGFSEDVMNWTVFAPVDEELVQFSGDFLSYFSLFMKHVVPCKVGWSDLEEMVNGTVLSNNVKGFSLEITRDENDEILMVNGVDIMFPDMYDSEWLVIHGIRGVIALPENAEDQETESMEEFPEEKVEAPDPESMEELPVEKVEARDRGEF
ncbi:putative fasciclin-like arabinogalactan protein 20 [Sesamum alatum]|uniref:Fasciclin-like arabinogalactan protein 20 n=1 Tax=Sesamum alatum TaxID=300844 RepID=A0AAE1Y525_9LAMI|nr:putative fasciclin-like arabinogalactan protein 20 [Sesamum alatum]